MKPSDKIWLKPECDKCDERCWSCAPFDDCEECGKETIGYVRDDIVLASTAEASRMFDRIEKLEAANLQQSLITVDHLSRIEKLEAALRLIAQHDYGLQGMIEDGTDTPENKVKYYAGQVIRRRHIARKALEGKEDE